MELLLKNVQKKHLGLIEELAKTLKIKVEGLSETENELLNNTEDESISLEEGLFLSWIKK